jgi:uncharacterized membrane protein
VGTILSGRDVDANAINAFGDVAGDDSYSVEHSTQAFFWRHGSTSIRDIGTLGGKMSYATACGLNGHGRVVGLYGSLVDGLDHAFTWKAGSVTLLPELAASQGSAAYAVDDDGLIVGQSAGVPVTWYGTTLERLPLPAWASGGAALAVNGQGQIGGYVVGARGERAIRWQPGGGFRVFGTLGGTASAASGINAQGDLAGEATDSRGVPHAVAWIGGSMRRLDASASESHATSINARDQVTYYVLLTSGVSARIWRAGASRYLDNLVPAGWHVYVPHSINDAGQIAAGAARSGDDYGRAVVLTPR